jgi:hypothetical protein
MRAAPDRPRDPFRVGGMGTRQGFDLIVLKPTCGARSQSARSHRMSRSRLFVIVTALGLGAISSKPIIRAEYLTSKGTDKGTSG